MKQNAKSRFSQIHKNCRYVLYGYDGSKIVNLLWKSSKNTTMGRFLKKCHTEYFLIYHFGKPLRCLTTSTPGFTKPTKFGKLDLKKGCDWVKFHRSNWRGSQIRRSLRNMTMLMILFCKLGLNLELILK